MSNVVSVLLKRTMEDRVQQTKIKKKKIKQIPCEGIIKRSFHAQSEKKETIKESKPVVQITPSQVFYFEGENLFTKEYRSAGILPFSITPENEIVVLLGKEIRKKKVVWSEFGGKIENKIDKGDPINTALREFKEETDGLYDEHFPSFYERLTPDKYKGPVIWNAQGKYVLYLMNVPYFEEDSQHKDLIDKPKLQYGWWRLSDVLKFATFKSDIVQPNDENNNDDKMNNIDNITITDAITENKDSKNDNLVETKNNDCINKEEKINLIANNGNNKNINNKDETFNRKNEQLFFFFRTTLSVQGAKDAISQYTSQSASLPI